MLGILRRGIGEIGHVGDSEIAIIGDVEIQAFEQGQQPGRAESDPNQCATLRGP